MRHSLIVAVLVFAASAANARGQDVASQSSRVDEVIADHMRDGRIPGLSLVVLKDGQIVKVAGYGLADTERRMPATPATVYKIASVSKQFIASGVMLLAQEDRLRLEDPVTKFLDGAPEAWNAIKVRHLLTHTSGLVREGPAFEPRTPKADIEVIASAYGRPLRFAPGEKYEYGNLNYFILAEIIRKVSGKPWTDYLQEKVFRASGMNATYPTNTTLEVPNLAQGYSDNDDPRPAAEWIALRPSGAFLSTVLDLAKWESVLVRGTVLADSTRRQMWTPVKLNDGTTYSYGFGWALDSLFGRPAVSHRGGMPGTRSVYARFPDEGITIIALMNLDDVDIDGILARVARVYLPARDR